MIERLSDLKTIAVVNTLQSCQLFMGLPSADLEHIAAISAAKSLAKGEYLFHEGGPAQGFYVVQTGAINVHRVSATGKEQVIHVFRPGESFAEAALTSDRGYPADARAIEDSQVLLVKKAGILALLKERPELALRMLGSMSCHLHVLVGQLEDLTMRDVETRLANWLIKRCPKRESDRPTVVKLPMTKRILAAELGTISETISRTFARFRELGLIAVKGDSITVLSPAKLNSLLRRNLGE